MDKDLIFVHFGATIVYVKPVKHIKPKWVEFSRKQKIYWRVLRSLCSGKVDDCSRNKAMTWCDTKLANLVTFRNKKQLLYIQIKF